MQIEGSSALVTGAGSGLGEATARAIVKRGARVTLLDLGGSRGAEIAADIGSNAQFIEAWLAPSIASDWRPRRWWATSRMKAASGA